MERTVRRKAGRGIRSLRGCGLPGLVSTRSKLSLPGSLVPVNRTHMGSCFFLVPLNSISWLAIRLRFL